MNIKKLVIGCAIGIVGMGIYTSPTYASSDEFIKGMDLSSLEAVEDAGGEFFDGNGNKINDILQYLKTDKDVNYVRLRIWNNPTTSFDAGDYCNKEHTIEMAQRIKQAGLKFLLDFHYSDTWADPSYQSKPEAWKDLNFSELKQAVYDYTADILNSLNTVGAYPDMVQVGNEISGGMLWEDGYIDNLDNLAELLNSGISAVRDTTPIDQKTKIMIHLAEGGDKERFEYFFDNMIARGVTDFDVIGMSYYPYWHGTPQDLKSNMNNIVKRYQKEVVVAETSYPQTYEDADSQPNLIGKEETDVVGLEANVENQKLMLETVFNTVANVDNDKGLGVFYWEPLWLPVDGVGVAKGQGNEWDNQILFDANFKELDSLNAYRFNKEEESINNDKDVIVYMPEDIIVDVEDTVSIEDILPTKVEVLQFDGDLISLPVSWNDVESVDLNRIGTYELSGRILGADPLDNVVLKQPTVTITVQRNLVKNNSFEDAYNTADWKISKEKGNAGQITIWDDSTSYSGVGSFQFWDDEPFVTILSQEIEVEENHNYCFSAYAQGIAENLEQAQLFVEYELNGATARLAETDIEFTYYNNWKKIQIDQIQIPSGVAKIKIGAKIKGNANGYGTLDDFTFVDNDNNAEKIIRNYIKNGTMEAELSDADNWTIKLQNNNWPELAGRTGNQNRTDNGSYSFHYYDPEVFTIGLAQEINELPSGYYTLTGWSYGSSNNKECNVYVANENGIYSTKIEDTNEWDSSTNKPIWKQFQITNIPVINGELRIDIDVQGEAGSWGYLDDITLIRQ
ncbi:MAG: glycosyl hydrolase 53 family protein [Clostridiales bacterium]|nr:glycosyl hydrolase 53 family protein [Clostridiales bacterium]